jgi:hypothetical protein
LSLDTDTAAAIVYSITYTLSADGASDLVVAIFLTVGCASNIGINVPSPLQAVAQQISFD